MFDLSNITLAFVQSHDAAMSFDAMTADMLQWHASGVYPANQDLIAALVAADRWGKGTCTVYASNLLSWARSGQTPRNISAVVKGKPDGHVKAKAGRKAGQGAGKKASPLTQPITAGGQEADKPTVPNEDRAWKLFLEGLRHQVPQRKDWESQDIVAFQDCIGKMIALINRNAK
jgi:hypothetical protein